MIAAILERPKTKYNTTPRIGRIRISIVQARYISDVSRFPVHENTTAEYFQVGDDMFPVLVRELKQAKKYIFIEYFIINDGVMWQTILNILEEKAAEGVDVRLIYDGFGCLTTLHH